MSLTEWQQKDAERAWAWRKHLSEHPIPLRFITAALEQYKRDIERSGYGHTCDDLCAEYGCTITPVELETAELVGVYLPAPICPDDVWAIEVKYNSRNNRFFMGISAEGKCNLYAN